jgi:hypothetical protein
MAEEEAINIGRATIFWIHDANPIKPLNIF